MKLIAAKVPGASQVCCWGHFCCHPLRARKALQPVDLELVLAVDTSTSVDAQEFALQSQGLAEAFLHPDVVAAIRFAGTRGVAITLVHWAGEARQATAVDWYVVRDGLSCC